MDTSHLLYASDLTDREWALLEPLLPPESPVGRPRLHSLRIILNAIFHALRAVVTPANIMDRDGVKLVLRAGVRTQFPRLRHVWLDAAYNGKGKGKDWIEQTLGWGAQIVSHPPRYKKVWVPNDIPPDQIDWSKYLPPPGFRVLPRRWVVERTFAWQGQQRRLSKDYERLCATSEALIYVTMIRLMLRRLARF